MARTLRDIVATYNEAEKYILYHEDDDILHTIKVKLPHPPPLEEIDGYGLIPKKQMFQRPETPERLLELEKETSSIQEIWDKLTHYKDIYEKEIEFIKREWNRRINGYWFFNNGTPTYIDGWHYTYLSHWKIDVGYPKYRSRDRKFFIFIRYAYTTTEAYYGYRVIENDSKEVLAYFSTEKETLNFLKDKDPDMFTGQKGNFFVDMHRRVCYGVNYPKHRREGATYKADHILFDIITTMEEVQGGIQSMDGTSAAKAFSKAIIKPWKKLPFYFSPVFSGSTNPKKVLEFDYVPERASSKTGSTANITTGLESFIDFADSANRSWYDGDKLMVLHNDECGKTTLEDVNQRWMVQKLCLAQAINIHGLAINTSTVGEMAEKGGDNFFRLCQLSHFQERNSIGQTTSGLFNLFIPAYDGLDGFIDRYGDSIIEDPPETKATFDRWESPVRDSSGNLVGAKRFLADKLEDILLRNDEQSIKDYEEAIRLSPTSFSQCFITAGSGSGLNMKNIIRRMRFLKFEKLTKRVDFVWRGGIRDTEVIMIDNQSNGRFIVSLELSRLEANLKIRDVIKNDLGEEIVTWKPQQPWRFTASADPYKFRKTEGKRMSKGTGAVFYNRDKSIDPDEKPISEWETFRTVCTYMNRPATPEEYSEDMLKMCVYYGAMMFPEINIPTIWDHFMLRGYSGYLKYERLSNGKFKNTPGFTTRGEKIQKIMQAHQLYIENYIELERHIEVLYQCKEIKGPEDLTNQDLFVAVGGAYMGSMIDYGGFYDTDNPDGFDVKGYY